MAVCFYMESNKLTTNLSYSLCKKFISFVMIYKITKKYKSILKGVVDMEQTFYVGMKICDYYAVYINDARYEQKEMVQENEIAGFVHCLQVLGYIEV